MSEHAKPFSDMAARIEAMQEDEFAGAVVVVPREGDSITFLLTDPSPKMAQFWSGLASRVEVAAAEAQIREQGTNNAFGMRR